jgi:hypothetical protein
MLWFVSRVYRATFKCAYGDGTLVQPSLHYQTDLPTGGDEPEPNDVAAGIWTMLGTAFLGTLASPITVASIDVSEQVLPPDIGVAGSHTVGSVGTGFGTGADLPRALVPIITLHTGISSRSARGHIFLGCPGDSTVLATGGIWDPTPQSYFGTLAALLDNSFDLGTAFVTHVNPVIYSRTRHARSLSPYTFRVTSATAKTHATWLRSRLSTP